MISLCHPKCTVGREVIVQSAIVLAFIIVIATKTTDLPSILQGPTTYSGGERRTTFLNLDHRIVCVPSVSVPQPVRQRRDGVVAAGPAPPGRIRHGGRETRLGHHRPQEQHARRRRRPETRQLGAVRVSEEGSNCFLPNFTGFWLA